MKTRLVTAIIMIVILLLLGLYLKYVELPAEKREIKKEEAERRLIDFKEEEITSLSILYLDREILLVKNSDGNWEMKKPIDAPADNQTIKNFISILVDNEIRKVVDESPPDLSIYGLDIPDIILTVTAKDKTTKILFGEDAPTLINFYLKKEEEKRVVLANLSLKKYLAERNETKTWEKKKE